MEEMKAKDVQEFFERVAADWDTMRLSYYDERVIERMAVVSGLRPLMRNWSMRNLRNYQEGFSPTRQETSLARVTKWPHNRIQLCRAGNG